MRRLSDDDGAIAVLVALVSVVLFGFGALAIDVTRLHQERRELQNGADAGALALAQSCGQGGCELGDDAVLGSLAQQYGNENARDLATNIQEVCGLGAPALAPCVDPPLNVPGNGYVMVRTRTGTATDAGIVPPMLARVLVGDDYNGTGHARAVAAWGRPSGVRAQLPLTFSLCELTELATDSDGLPVYADPENPDPALEKVIYFHTTVEAGTCINEESGADLPGGFGWVESDGCTAVVENGWYDSKTGVPIPNDCKKQSPECKFDESGLPIDGCLEKYVDQVLLMPIYDVTNGLTGTNGEYHFERYAAFLLTGWRFSGSSYASPNLGVPCLPSQSCISGYFVQDSGGGGQVTDGESWGLTVYQLVN